MSTRPGYSITRWLWREFGGMRLLIKWKKKVLHEEVLPAPIVTSVPPHSKHAKHLKRHPRFFFFETVVFCSDGRPDPFEERELVDVVIMLREAILRVRDEGLDILGQSLDTAHVTSPRCPLGQQLGFAAPDLLVRVVAAHGKTCSELAASSGSSAISPEFTGGARTRQSTPHPKPSLAIKHMFSVSVASPPFLPPRSILHA